MGTVSYSFGACLSFRSFFSLFATRAYHAALVCRGPVSEAQYQPLCLDGFPDLWCVVRLPGSGRVWPAFAIADRHLSPA